MNVVHVIVHDEKQARLIIEEAARIADETEYSDRRWEVVFGKACDLLGQRATVTVEQPSVPFDLAGLRGTG